MSDKQALSTESYKGVRDFYPSDWATLSTVFSKTREVLSSYGYEEYQASPLEHSELYESKGNEEIIREQTFSFEDRGGRRVTLRPEMTPTLARMIAGKRRELAFPLRWFSIGNRFRYERPQKGRLREFFQTDVDLVGAPQGEADLEVIGLASTIMKSFGANDADFVIRINSRKLLRMASTAAGHDADTSRVYLRLLDRKEKISKEDYAAELAKLGAEDPLSIIENASTGEMAEERMRIESVVKTLQERGVKNAKFDPTLTRGFDYYTGVVFEVFDTNPENPRALFGGGRYDELVTLFGGDPIPAVGFAFGDVTFLDFLATHNLLPKTTTGPEVYIGTPSPEDMPAAQAFAATLRAKGLRTFVNLATNKSLGDQIKDAVRRFIPYFIAYGTQEAKSKKVTVKTLVSGKEKKVGIKDVAKIVAK